MIVIKKINKDKLVKCSEKWQMLFNFEKCKCLHTGYGNLNVNFIMGNTVLGTKKNDRLRNCNKCWYESFRAVCSFNE